MYLCVRYFVNLSLQSSVLINMFVVKFCSLDGLLSIKTALLMKILSSIVSSEWRQSVCYFQVPHFHWESQKSLSFYTSNKGWFVHRRLLVFATNCFSSSARATSFPSPTRLRLVRSYLILRSPRNSRKNRGSVDRATSFPESLIRSRGR